MKSIKFTACALFFNLLFAQTSICYATSIEVAFSPNEGAEGLVLKVIHNANSTIRLAAYSLTSPQIVNALIQARKRGVDVAVVADSKMNLKSDSRAGRVALNLLSDNGVRTRVIDRYEIHHDKYIIADGQNVETGSFNYSKAAELYNSENVMVVWGNVELANRYLAHWQSRFDQGIEYRNQ